jgi:sortase A
MRRKRWGTVLAGLGCLLLGLAFALTAYNLLQERAADRFAAQTAEELGTIIPQRGSDAAQLTAGSSETGTTATVPQSVAVGGEEYLGVLSIPALGLTLPVNSTWSYPLLRKSPCCYQGSALTKDLVIAGHNYRRHFGNLKLLRPGDEVRFTDADGYVYRYAVSDVETLAGDDVEGMSAGNWDLTLFTCTIGGARRVTVRCCLAA